jgi:hypothetical protein
LPIITGIIKSKRKVVSVANNTSHGQIEEKGLFTLPIITGTKSNQRERFVFVFKNNMHNQIKGRGLFLLLIISATIK